MARLAPRPVRPGMVRVGDLILCEEQHDDMILSRRGRVAKININKSETLAVTAGGRVLFVWDITKPLRIKIFIVEASRIDTLTELEIPHDGE